MDRSVEVILSPSLRPLYDLEGKICVVIDVLRATTTVCAALDNGALSVIPVRDVEQALSLQKEGNLVGGERNGIKISEFDFGNSPKEYTPELIEHKKVVLTTTNGTKAIDLSSDAKEIFAASFANISALCAYLKSSDLDIVLFCAGWKNRVNLEDSLFAATVMHSLSDYCAPTGDSAQLLKQWYDGLDNNLTRGKILRNASHVHRFEKLGVTDLEYCITDDLHPVLPKLQNGELVDIHS